MTDFIAESNNQSVVTKLGEIILSVGCDTNKLIQSYKEKSFRVDVKSKLRDFKTSVIQKENFILVTE